MADHKQTEFINEGWPNNQLQLKLHIAKFCILPLRGSKVKIVIYDTNIKAVRHRAPAENNCLDNLWTFSCFNEYRAKF